MRPWQLIAFTAIVIAGLLSAAASHEPFDSRLVRLEAQQALPAPASAQRIGMRRLGVKQARWHHVPA